MLTAALHAEATTGRRLKGANQLPMVIEDVAFSDGVVEKSYGI